MLVAFNDVWLFQAIKLEAIKSSFNEGRSVSYIDTRGKTFDAGLHAAHGNVL